jgi:hypothetical protein
MLQLGIRGLGIARLKFNPLSWFAKGEPGAWYDPSDLTSLFQDSAGTLPAVLEYPVGLMLDKSKGLALGAELVTNGDFSNGTTGWTQSTPGYWVVSGGMAYHALSNVYNSLVQEVVSTSPVKISFNCNLITATGTAAWFYVNNANTVRSVPLTTGLSTITFIAMDGIKTFGVSRVSGFIAEMYIDNISVRQIAGNHAFQATSANRPILSSRVNLLTKTEDFSDGAWSKNGLTTTTNTLTETATTATAIHDIECSISQPVNTITTATVKVKPNGRDFCTLSITGQNANYYHCVTFDLINKNASKTGVGSVSGTLVSHSITPTDDGYLLLSVTGYLNSTSIYFSLCLNSTGTPTYNTYGLEQYLGDITKGLFIKQADLRPTNSGALLPAYQRVNTASDYDSVGFPLYLKCNGLQSAMSTNSIDFTATDKMTVVAGVRKLSDANFNVLAELSSDSTISSGNGAWLLIVGRTPEKASWGARGTLSREVYGDVSFSSPISEVFTGLAAILSPSLVFRNNGVEKSTLASSLGTGNFGNYPLYLFARAGTAYQLNGNFYGAIIRGAQSDTASVTQTEQYMATKTGITF